MLRLLPAARQYSRATISDFQVGAVAKARMTNNASDFSLFLGANIEFPAQALTQTIHAEQSAIINAWLQGAKQIDDVAVNAAPCGCCRQFLHELEGSQNLTILIHDSIDGKSTRNNLSDLLPTAFGPRELGSATGLMAAAAQPADLKLKLSSNDPFVLEAAAAAKKSYAPYSRNFAGCAIKSADGKIICRPLCRERGLQSKPLSAAYRHHQHDPGSPRDWKLYQPGSTGRATDFHPPTCCL